MSRVSDSAETFRNLHALSGRATESRVFGFAGVGRGTHSTGVRDPAPRKKYRHFMQQVISEAWTRYVQGDARGAAELSRKILDKTPGDHAALVCNAMSSWELGVDAAACLAQLRLAVELAPNEGWIWHNLGTMQASVGQLDEARQSYLKALELKPDDTHAFYGLAQNSRFTEETELVRAMLARYASGELSQREMEYVCFALAKIYDDLGRHARAIHFCIEGNWLARRPYDAVRARSDVAELRRLVAGKRFAGLKPGAATHAARPVFVVGMPRSGTTLVETILSRHPEVYAGGEMQHIVDVENALGQWARQRGYEGGPYGMLGEIPAEFFTRNAEAVLARIREVAPAPFSVFTDKLPENSLRLGLISLLFPDARIIYMRRHPLDCCLSVLFLHFTRGNGYAFQQSLLGERYRQVAETMDLWKQSLSLPILDVSYEALVSDPEPTIRRIIDFAGLPWDDACLTPERSTRSVGTANQFQVRQPINRASVGRWRRYEEWIQPLITSLGGFDWIDAVGREIEALAA